MRWWIRCLAVYAAFVVLHSAARAELVGYWSFDDNGGSQLTDSSDNGLHGTLVSSPTWIAGHTGGTGDYALQFNGSNYVSLGNPAELSIIGDQTISLWVYPTDKSTRRNPYAKAYAGSGTLTQNTSASSTTTSMTYYYGNYGGNGGMGNPNPALGQTGYEQRGVSPITMNAWNHVVVTRSLKPTPGTGLITSYVNGVPTATYAPIFTSPDGPYPVVADSLTAYFARGYVSNYIGSIDDSQIYDVALSAEEVKWLYQNPQQSVPTWDGSTGTWDTAGSWSTGTVPNLSAGSDSARIDTGEVTYVPGADFAIDNGNSLNLSGTGTWKQTAANVIRIGNTSNGSVHQTGGTFDAAGADNVVLGATAGAVGTYNLGGGTLRVKAIGQGAGTAQFNFDGGTLQAVAPFSTPLAMTIHGNGATIDTGGHNVSLSGNLAAGTGSGTLTKTGAGTLTLDGVLGYTGGTTVDGGTLVLHRAGTLASGNTGQFTSSGHTVTVSEGATLQFTNYWVTGDGRQHELVVNGGTVDFAAGGNYQSDITLTGGHIKTSGSGYAWRTGYFKNGEITVNASDTSSTIEGQLCFVRYGTVTKTTFDVADGTAADDLVVSANIVDHVGNYGGMALVKDGPGKMVLSGTSTFIGNVEIAQGVLEATSLGNKGVAGNLGQGTTITLGSNGYDGTLKLSTIGVRETDRDVVLATGGSGTFDVSDFIDLQGVISGDGDFIKAGNNDPGNSGSRLSLVAENTFTGDMYINAGVVQVARVGGAIPDTADVHIAGGAGNGRLRVHRDEVINGLFGDGAVQTYAAQARVLTIGAGGGDGNFSGTIEPGITLVKAGVGTQVLSGTSTFTGNVTVADGVLVATSLGHKGVPGNLGAGTTITLGSDGHNGTLRLSTGGVRHVNRDIVLTAGGSGTFEVSDFIDLQGIISGDGDFIKTGTNAGGHNSGSRMSLSGNNIYTGDTYITEGVVQVARNGGAIPDTSNVHITGGAGNGRLRLVYYGETINGLFGDGIVQTYSLQNQTLTIGAADGDGDFSGTIEPGITLVKAGAGTQVLSGANTYTGTTTVNGGTLLVNGTHTVGGPYTVNTGGTLGGTGTIGSLTTVADGGALSPGASVGLLTFENELAFETGATLEWEFHNIGVAGADYDSIAGTTLSLPSVVGYDPELDEKLLSLDIVGLEGYSLSAGDSFTLFAGDEVYVGETLLGIGEDISPIFAFTDNMDWWGTWEVTIDRSIAGNLMLTAVPEPATSLLAVVGLLSVAFCFGRRSKR